MRLHRPHRRQHPALPSAPRAEKTGEEVERSRLLAQLERERRRVTSLDADVRSIARRQEDMRRRARPTLPLSFLPSAPDTHDGCIHAEPIQNGTPDTTSTGIINGTSNGVATRSPSRSQSTMIRRDTELDAHTQLAIARLDEAAALRRIERAERLIKIQTIEGLLSRLIPVGGEEGYEEGSERESVLTA